MSELIPPYLLDGCCCAPGVGYQIRTVHAFGSQVGSDVHWTVTRSGLSNVTGIATGTTDAHTVIDGLLVTYPITSAAWSSVLYPEYDYLIAWEAFASGNASTTGGKQTEQIRFTATRGVDRLLYTYITEDGEDDVYPSNSGIYAAEVELPLILTTDAGLADHMVSDPIDLTIPAWPTYPVSRNNRRSNIIRRITSNY